MGMNNPLVRWWVTFSVMAIVLITALVAGLGKLILEGDKTFLSWGILAIFFGTSVHLGRNARIVGGDCTSREILDGERVSDTVTYYVETCTALGLLGTIIGLIMMMHGTFVNIDIGNAESTKAALAQISGGIGTALITTMVGLISAILLRFQLKVVE
jgi:hypothetical protein